ncbi:MAG TPA: hypothetical protein VNA69_10370 [Thermoanaerobaculia bacterium]|nr:hypothetical protein [Thermoanaerobaculia bacterium]
MFTSCSGSDIDQLSAARRRLRTAPCGASPAVTAVAGVNATPRQVYVGDWLVVSVCHLQKFFESAEAAQAPITLFLEGMDTGNEPVGVDLESGTLTFVLDRNEQNRDLWRPFLYNPLFDPDVAMRVSVGIRGERPLPRVPGANLEVRVRKIYVDWTTWVWLAFLFAFVVLMILCAVYTDVLRDGSADVVKRAEGVKRPYSLGRVQMAWWFFLVVLSYSFIWLVTGDRDTIPPSILGLIGISSATALAAAIIAPSQSERQDPRQSQGWWRDLAAGENGAVALDRLQVVVWTLVLSGIFLFSVVWELTMPEFSGTLLALMGVSSGTYIGFKLPQKS